LCVCVHREFYHESVGERILKIGLNLPKLLSNITSNMTSFIETVSTLNCSVVLQVCKLFERALYIRSENEAEHHV